MNGGSKWVMPVVIAVIALAVVAVLFFNREPGHADAPGDQPAADAHAHAGHSMAVTGASGRFMPMVAQDGPHYGATVRMPGHGRYRLTYTISPPDPEQFGRHTDPITGVAPWFEPFRVEFDFDYRGVPQPGSEEEKKRGIEVKPGFREYPIEPAEGHEQAHLEIRAVWLPPIQMEGMTLPQDPDVIHLEADIAAAPGNPNGFEAGTWVPYLRVEYEMAEVK